MAQTGKFVLRRAGGETPPLRHVDCLNRDLQDYGIFRIRGRPTEEDFILKIIGFGKLNGSEIWVCKVFVT